MTRVPMRRLFTGIALPSRIPAPEAATFDAADAGTWRVRYVRAVDVKFLQRVLYTADLQAAGYPTELVVTAP